MSDAVDETPPDQERSTIARNMVQLMASQVVTWTMTTAIAVIVPRYLGPDGVGQLRLALSIWAIVQVVVGLGTSMYLTLAIARDRAAGLALVGPIAALRTAAFVGASVVVGLVMVWSRPDAEFVIIMGLAGLSVLFATWFDVVNAAFLGIERTAPPVRAGVIARVSGATVTIVGVVLGGGAPFVVGVGAASGALSLVLLSSSARRLTTVRVRGWHSHAIAIVRASAGFMVSTVLITVYREIDVVVMSTLVDREALGWYGTADQLIGSSLFVVTIVMSSIFPVLGRLHVDDRTAFTDLVTRAFGSLLLAAVPIGLGIVLVSDAVVPLLFGEAFRPTAQVLTVYGFVSPLTFGTILFGTVALTTGRQGFWNSVVAVSIVLTVPLDLVFIPWADRTYANGAIGGAMAYMATEGFMFVIGLAVICPFLLSRVVLWRSVRILAAGGVMFAAVWPLRDRLLLVPVAVGIVVYVASIAAFRVLTDDERAIVRRLLGKLRRRRHDPHDRTGPVS